MTVTVLVLVRGKIFLYHLKAYMYSFFFTSDDIFLCPLPFFFFSLFFNHEGGKKKIVIYKEINYIYKLSDDIFFFPLISNIKVTEFLVNLTLRYLLNTSLNLRNTYLHLINTYFHLLNTYVHLLNTYLYLLNTTLHLLNSYLNLIKTYLIY